MLLVATKQFLNLELALVLQIIQKARWHPVGIEVVREFLEPDLKVCDTFRTGCSIRRPEQYKFIQFMHHVHSTMKLTSEYDDWTYLDNLRHPRQCQLL
jgi:hypothetical protein